MLCRTSAPSAFKIAPSSLKQPRCLRQGGKNGRQLAPRTVGHAHRLLHRALGHAATWGVVAQNVASVVNPPRVPETELTILTEDQIGAALRHLDGRTLRPIVSFLFGTGCRRGEVLALRWVDVDWNARGCASSVRLNRPKKAASVLSHRRQRTAGGMFLFRLGARRTARIVLASKNVAYRWDWGKRQTTRWYSQSGRFDPIATLAYSEIRLAMDDLKIDCTLHALRHTHVSQLIAAGMDVLTISRRLGHASAAITLKVYGHLFANTDAMAAEILEETFAKVQTQPLATS